MKSMEVEYEPAELDCVISNNPSCMYNENGIPGNIGFMKQYWCKSKTSTVVEYAYF